MHRLGGFIRHEIRKEYVMERESKDCNSAVSHTKDNWRTRNTIRIYSSEIALGRRICHNSIPPNKKSTSSEVLFRKIHQVRKAFPKNPPTAIYSHCSWWVFGSGTLQLVDFSNQHLAVGGFSLGGVELQLSSFRSYLDVEWDIKVIP